MSKTSSIIITILLVLVLFFGASWLMQENDRKETQDEITNQEEEIENIIKDVNMDKKELQIEVLQEGQGEEAVNGKTVAVHYTGVLEDGTKFDSSLDRGTPFEFTLGTGMVIQGWDQGVLGMKIGEKRRLTVPSDLAYGDRGIVLPDGTVLIPGGATLIFEVELLEFK
jgi:FKBP-type peptidyl-prolyl cis-trans isomerase